MSDTPPFDSFLKWKLGIESPSFAYAAKTVTRSIIFAVDVPYPLLKAWNELIKIYNNNNSRNVTNNTQRCADSETRTAAGTRLQLAPLTVLDFWPCNLPSSLEGKPRETSHARTALEANGYPSTIISNILNKKPLPSTVPSPEELFFKWVEPLDTYQGFACLPYISGLTEPLTRLLRNSEIRVVNKPFKILQQEFPSPKFRQPSDLQCNVVDKIPCKDCPWNYIEETVMCRVQYP